MDKILKNRYDGKVCTVYYRDVSEGTNMISIESTTSTVIFGSNLILTYHNDKPILLPYTSIISIHPKDIKVIQDITDKEV